MKTIKKTFTLIELIVVIAIIAILAAVIASNTFRFIEKAKIAKAVSDYKTIKAAAYALYADTGRWPLSRNCDVLVYDCFLIKPVYDDPVHTCPSIQNQPPLDGWDGPYLDGGIGKHPWGGTYMLEGGMDFNPSSAIEMCIDFDNWKYPDGPNLAETAVPDSARQKIDNALDDGNLDTGAFRRRAGVPGSFPDTVWVIAWDVL